MRLKFPVLLKVYLRNLSKHLLELVVKSLQVSGALFDNVKLASDSFRVLQSFENLVLDT